MDGLRLSRNLLVLAALWSVGCTTSPWSAKRAAPAAPPSGTPPSVSSGSKTPAASVFPPSPQLSDAENREIEAMVVEIDRQRTLDPDVRQRLLADLRQTEPQLRPLVIQSYRAALAYRQQTEQSVSSRGRESKPGAEGMAGSVGGPMPGMPNPDQGRYPCAVAAPRTGELSAAGPVDREPAGPPPSQRFAPAGTMAAGGSRMAGGQATASDQLAPAGREGSVDRNLPPDQGGPARQADAALASRGRAQPPLGDQADGARAGTAKSLDNQSARASPGGVRLASYDAPPGGNRDWQQELSAAIRGLETALPGAPQSADDLSAHARLRILYLLANRREDALRPILGTPPGLQDLQEFWSDQVYALAVWLDTQRITDSHRRAEEARCHLQRAAQRLAEMSPLVVRNLAFVTEVQSFGSFKPCAKCEFAPDDHVLLYAEVENLKAEERPKGYHTAWRSSYQILDSHGQVVASHEPTASEEYCQSPRRDFFIGCQLRLPKRIYPGVHTLQFSVEDLKSQRSGQSSVEFTVKAEAAAK
jgi:hypothetical protein